MPTRCFWANTTEPLYLKYHDEEWGVPVHDDHKLFEFLILEGAQAGLNWYTILRKRPGYQEAFDGFDPSKIATYGEEKVNELMQNTGIIRNRLKINATIRNAQAFLKIRDELGSFDTYMWQFVNGKPIINNWTSGHEIPAVTDLSRRMSKDLLQRGFRFVGPTICYAYMQAVGIVNDHTTDCFRFNEILEIFGK
jgi:DNA-3-methyladenine glycosylase I